MTWKLSDKSCFVLVVKTSKNSVVATALVMFRFLLLGDSEERSGWDSIWFETNEECLGFQNWLVRFYVAMIMWLSSLSKQKSWFFENCVTEYLNDWAINQEPNRWFLFSEQECLVLPESKESCETMEKGFLRFGFFVVDLTAERWRAL